MEKKLTGIELIAEERQRQITSEEWTPEHDATHTDGSLAIAAACYALPHIIAPLIDDGGSIFLSVKRYSFWPWNYRWWKPSPDNRVRELVKAGALIAAEIDRIQNLKPTT